MKILIHTYLFTPDEITNAYLYHDLSVELTRLGAEVTVLSCMPHYNIIPDTVSKVSFDKCGCNWLYHSKQDSVNVWHVVMPRKSKGSRSRLKSWAQFNALSLMASHRIEHHDIVISSSPPLTCGMVGSAIARRWHAKSIYIVQDIFPDGLINDGKINNRLLIWILRLLEKQVYRNNDAVVGIGKIFNSILAPRVTPSEKLRMIPNFVDTDLYKPLPVDYEFVNRYSLDGRFVVSYAGNIGNAQDLMPLLIAAKSLIDKPIKFVIAGDGINLDIYQNYVKEMGLHNVVFTGYLPREEMPKLMSVSNLCCVLLHRHIRSYGFPSKILTIMASGKVPVVIADENSDIHSLLVDTRCGLFNKHDNINEFVDNILGAYMNTIDINEMAARGRNYVLSNHSVGVIAKMYYDLCCELHNTKNRDSWHA